MPDGRRGAVALPAPDAQRPLDVLELDLAAVGEGDADLAGDLGMDHVGDQDAARRGLAFEAGRDIDAVAENVAALEDDVAEIDADAQMHRGLDREVALGHGALHGERALDRVDDAAELDQRAVAHHLDDTAATGSDGGVEGVGPDLPECRQRAGFVGAHHRGIADDVGGKDGGEPPGDVGLGHAGAGRAHGRPRGANR